MRKSILFVALFIGATVFGQENATSEILKLNKVVMNSNVRAERDSAVAKMYKLLDNVSAVEKPIVYKLVKESKSLAEMKNNVIEAKDLSVLTKEDLKKIDKETDKFSGKTTLRPSFMYVNPTIRIKLVWNNNTEAMYFISQYEGRDWLFMDKAILLIDGEKYEYKLNGDDRDVGSTARVYESSVDIVDSNMMNIVRAIANSKTPIEVRFSGRKGNSDFKLPEKTKERFALMLNIYEKLKK